MMTKKEFAKLYSKMHGIKNIKKAKKDVDEFLDTMKEMFEKYPKVVFRGFGTFEVRETKARSILDPRNQKDIIHSKPRKYIKLKVSKNIEKNLYEDKK